MGEADADPAAEPPVAADAGATPSNAVEASQAGDGVAVFAQSAATAEPRPAPAPAADGQPPRMESADPWAAILEAGAALLQGLATPRAAGGAAPAAAPVTIERDPVTGQASVRLPLPDAAVLQRLAKAFEPWLR